MGFGSSRLMSKQGFDSLSIGDDVFVTAGYVVLLSDTVVVSDILIPYSLLPDDILVEESLIFNSGFGCSVVGSTGFGLNNFGR